MNTVEINDQADTSTKPSVTIVVTPRERFGVALEAFESIVELTDEPIDLIYVDAGSPAHIATRISDMCAKSGFQYCRLDHFLSPNQARNFGYRKAQTPYIAFLDNDVIVSNGWLNSLLNRAKESGADVVVPLTCQKRPLHTEIHQAGGRITEDVQAFLNGPPEQRRLVDEHILQGQKVAEVDLMAGETQCCEFHCVLVRKTALDRTGGLDEELLATKEHLDFSLGVWKAGGKIVFEPESIVTYLFPDRKSPLTSEDWAFFTLRWSPLWLVKSQEHFQKKWELVADPFFEQRKDGLTWRHRLGIAVPVAASVPVLGRSALFRRYCAGALTRVLHVWSLWLNRQQTQKAQHSA